MTRKPAPPSEPRKPPRRRSERKAINRDRDEMAEWLVSTAETALADATPGSIAHVQLLRELRVLHDRLSELRDAAENERRAGMTDEALSEELIQTCMALPLPLRLRIAQAIGPEALRA